VTPGQVLRAGGGIFEITTVTSANQVSGTVTQAITSPPVGINNWLFFPGSWSVSSPGTQFFGLDQLIGLTVSINADGSPQPQQVVAADGSITLLQPASKVTAGLPYTCTGQTMPLDVGEPTVQGKRKKIAAVTFKVADTRGLSTGRTLSEMVPIKEMDSSIPIGTPPPLFSGDERIIMDALYDVLGQYYFQVTDPLPATVLGVVPEVVIGDTK
jgi:hypothetical protein